MRKWRWPRIDRDRIDGMSVEEYARAQTGMISAACPEKGLSAADEQSIASAEPPPRAGGEGGGAPASAAPTYHEHRPGVVTRLNGVPQCRAKSVCEVCGAEIWLSSRGPGAGTWRAAPYPWCIGAPTIADCARRGYCPKDPNCGE